jgi:hypothetical protein
MHVSYTLRMQHDTPSVGVSVVFGTSRRMIDKTRRSKFRVGTTCCNMLPMQSTGHSPLIAKPERAQSVFGDLSHLSDLMFSVTHISQIVDTMICVHTKRTGAQPRWRVRACKRMLACLFCDTKESASPRNHTCVQQQCTVQSRLPQCADKPTLHKKQKLTSTAID